MTTPEDPNQPPQDATPPPPPPPEYGAPPAYSAPPPAYGAPNPQFGAPPAGYGMPPAQYGGPAAAYASWGQRVGATLIDGIVAAIPGLILIFIGAAIGHGIGVFILLIGYLVILGISLWNVVFRQGTTGQSIGKSQLNIKLVREVDGQVVGPGMAFVRQLAHVVDSIPCDIGYLWPLWDAKKQTFADKIMSTIVIKL